MSFLSAGDNNDGPKRAHTFRPGSEYPATHTTTSWFHVPREFGMSPGTRTRPAVRTFGTFSELVSAQRPRERASGGGGCERSEWTPPRGSMNCDGRVRGKQRHFGLEKSMRDAEIFVSFPIGESECEF